MGWDFVIIGYVLAGLLFLTYSVTLLRKGRALAARVPEDKRTFLD